MGSSHISFSLELFSFISISLVLFIGNYPKIDWLIGILLLTDFFLLLILRRQTKERVNFLLLFFTFSK